MVGKKSKEVANTNAPEPVGRAVDELSLSERLEHAGKWVAFRMYTPPGKVSREGVEYVDVRLRTIEAAGSSFQECHSQLRSRNLDPSEFEFTLLNPPY